MLNVRTSFIKLITKPYSNEVPLQKQNIDPESIVDTNIDPHYRKIEKNEGK